MWKLRITRCILALLPMIAAPVGAEIRFELAPSFPCVAAPTTLAAGDLNNDGLPEVVVANSGLNSLSVWWNIGIANGQGAIRSEIGDIGGSARSIEIVDVDNDGLNDIVLANGSANVSIMKNLGGGNSFARLSVFAGAGAIVARVGDMNRDARLDLVVLNQSATPAVSMLLGQGGGVFAPRVASSTGPYPASDLCIAPSGFYPEVIVTAGTGIEVFYDLGQQAPAPFTWFPAPPGAQVTGSPIYADVTLDGLPDVVAADSGCWMYANQGDNNFGSPFTPSRIGPGTAPSTHCLAVVDMDQDGRSDIVIVDDNARTCVGHNAWETESFDFVRWGCGRAPGALAVADFNLDGFPDIVTADRSDHTISFLRNLGNGKFSARRDAGNDGYDQLVADFGSDGRADLASSGVLYRNLGDALFVATQFFSGSGGSSARPASAVADLDRDGHPDVVTPEVQDGLVRVAISYGHGNNQFDPTVELTVPAFGAARAVAVGDYDGDGILDIAVSSLDLPSSARLALFRGLGGHLFALASSINSGGSVLLCMSAADVDGDGRSDLVMAAGQVIEVLKCQAGGWSLMDHRATASDMTDCKTADLDGDGYADAIVTWTAPANQGIQVFYGNSLGFDAQAVATLAQANAVALADLDGDDRPEIVTIGMSTMSVLRNEGNRTFTPTLFPAPFGSSLALGDFDGDGRSDVLVLSSPAAFYRNRTGVPTDTAADSPVARTSMLTAWPNPFNPSVRLQFAATGRGPARFDILTASGALVRTVIRDVTRPGPVSLAWEGRDQRGATVPAGIYFVRVTQGATSATHKLVLVK